MRLCFSFINFKALAIFTVIAIIFCGMANNLQSQNIVLDNNCTNEIISISPLEEIIDKSIWKLEIPKIDLVADISDGTDFMTLNKYIGHFEDTPQNKGNVCLAGHNRGYSVNYFEKIKELEIGDEIYYTYNGMKHKYIVNSKDIIKDTDWEKLENTEDNRLTLITCVENEPELRRCIQAIEKN